MKKTFILFILFIVSFFLYEPVKVNSFDEIALLYNKNELYEQGRFNLYFYSLNSFDLNLILKNKNIKLISVTPYENSYGVGTLYPEGNTSEEIINSLNEQYNRYLIAGEYNNTIQNGFGVYKIKVECLVKDLIIIEKSLNVI